MKDFLDFLLIIIHSFQIFHLIDYVAILFHFQKLVFDLIISKFWKRIEFDFAKIDQFWLLIFSFAKNSFSHKLKITTHSLLFLQITGRI